MSLSKHDGTADLLPFSCRRGPTMSSHTEVCRPPCHLWGHCCDTGLVLDYRRAEGDSGPQMHGCLGGICFSFLWKALKWEGFPLPERGLQGQNLCVASFPASSRGPALPRFLSCWTKPAGLHQHSSSPWLHLLLLHVTRFPCLARDEDKRCEEH